MSILIDETTKRVALQAEDHRVARVAQASRIFVREIAQLRKQLVEVLEEQTATSEVLRIISNSPNKIQPVLGAVAENAARLCDASNAVIFRLESDLLQLAASYGEIPATSQARAKIPTNRDTVTIADIEVRVGLLAHN